MVSIHPLKVIVKLSLPIRILLSILFIYFLPIFLDHANSSWLAYSYTKDQAIFEYLGFAGAICLLINFAIEWKQRSSEPFQNKIYLIAICLFAAYQFLFFSELSHVGYDYLAYQESVRSLLAHQSPYSSAYNALHPYIYPPLLVQVMTFLYNVIRWTWLHAAGQLLDGEAIFSQLFYSYQFVQLCLTILCFSLSYRLARRLRLEPVQAIILVSGLFLLNLPLFRNFSQNQVNLWILASLLLAILWIDKQPLLAGIVIAAGTHLKLYPAVELIPWLLKKKWRALLAFGVAFIAILWIEIVSSPVSHLWLDFLQYMSNVEKGAALRNNSLTSLAYNLARLVFWNQPKQVTVLSAALTIILTFVLGGWVLLRMFRRSRKSTVSTSMQMIGMMMDSIFLMFFISPSVWDHHLVSAIPLVIWAFARFPRQRYLMISLAAALIFLFPTYDVFFFSYSRLFGLILLLYGTEPSREVPDIGFASKQSIDGLERTVAIR